MKKVILNITCRRCGKTHEVTVDYSDLYSWGLDELLTSEVFPYLTSNEQKLLDTEICCG